MLLILYVFRMWFTCDTINLHVICTKLRCNFINFTCVSHVITMRSHAVRMRTLCEPNSSLFRSHVKKVVGVRYIAFRMRNHKYRMRIACGSHVNYKYFHMWKSVDIWFRMRNLILRMRHACATHVKCKIFSHVKIGVPVRNITVRMRTCWLSHAIFSGVRMWCRTLT